MRYLCHISVIVRLVGRTRKWTIMKSDSVIIIPTYNEKENIEKMIRALMALEHSFDVLVVDDGSPDGTAAIVKSLQQELAGRVHLIEREG